MGNVTYSTLSITSVRCARRQSIERGTRDVEADHALDVGDGNEQGPVRVAFPHHGVDLEHGMRGIPRVEADAVIDDSLEDRQRAHSHATMLAPCGP